MQVFIFLLALLFAQPAFATPGVHAYIAEKLMAEHGLMPAEATAKKIAPLIERAATKHSLDPALLASVMWHESNFDMASRSEAGALGLLQVMPVHWKAYGYGGMLKGRRWKHYPDVQVELGCKVLLQYKKFVEAKYPDLSEEQKWHYALRAYNQGPRHASRGSSRYSRRILKDKNLIKSRIY